MGLVKAGTNGKGAIYLDSGLVRMLSPESDGGSSVGYDYDGAIVHIYCRESSDEIAANLGIGDGHETFEVPSGTLEEALVGLSDVDDGEAADFTFREKCLDTAKGLVTGDRNKQYGDPRWDFLATAAIWTAYLANKLAPGMSLEPHDVAAMMVGLKLSRLRESPGKDDHWIDIAGYAACGMECAELDKRDREEASRA